MNPLPESQYARPRQRPDERSRQRADGDRPLSATLPLPGEHFAAIERSHARCAALGLSRIESPAYDPISCADLNIARERNLRLHSHAAPVMELLYEQIVNTQCAVMLTDSRGTIIHSIGDDDFLARAAKVALQPGVNWSEAARGTNGMGTTLMNEAPTLVHADEHFMHANQFLTCSAAPIFDPRGNMLGVLDVTGDHRGYHQHTMGLVKMSARMIENHWLTDDFRQLMRLHFHSRPEFIGTLMEGVVAVARDGRIVGANRSALDQLAISGAAVRMHSVTSLFGTTVGALVDHFRSPLAMPLALALPGGNQVHAQARFNWSAAYGIGDGDGEPVHGDAQPAPPAAANDAVANHGAGAAGGLRYLRTGDAQMEAVLAKVQRVIDRDVPVLLLGETGTGKELLARAIHHDSSRARHPFVAVNCASIPETLIEAELFGYEEGAFTGARRKGAPGKIVQANGGTLFLDEIGDMPLALQARLLRVLAERIVSPLGSTKTVTVDVAIVGATHCNLREMIAKNQFREDLYYRLNGLVVRIPPLRERSDLDVLVRNILRAESPRGFLDVDADVMQLIHAYPWPGNIRQLANVLRTAALMAAGGARITREHLSDDFLEDAQAALAVQPAAEPAARAAAAAAPAAVAALPAGGTLEQLELAMIRQAVEAAGGNISEASKRLGISRNTIYRKLRWRRNA